MNNFEQGMQRNDANFVPLTPLSFLDRIKDVYPDYEALIYQDRKYTWKQVYDRCIQFASALNKIGIAEGDVVSIMAANTPELFEAHYSVPMTGGVINTINTRLDVRTVAYILDHSDCKVFIVDRQFQKVASEALAQVDREITVIDIDDQHAGLGEIPSLGKLEYESFLLSGDKDFEWVRPKDEWQAISLSYTSGTTGNPKGVVYHHRGSYLMSMGSVSAWNMPNRLTYLYTVPMFHCNGWGYPWTLAMLHARVVFVRNIIVKDIFDLIDKYEVTHFGGAPIVLNIIANAPPEDQKLLKNKIYVMTAGAPPPSSILQKMESLGFEVMHVYGLTETYGHVTHCAWNEDWNNLSEEDRFERKSFQGVRYPHTEVVTVLNPDTFEPVPFDGETMGEIMIRGNTVMKGYYKNEEATKLSLKNGWFHSGDLAVIHPNGYIQVKDRSKDIIISGGENISSVEIENIIIKHPTVSLAAVVARPDEKWGETPCAFIELAEGQDVTEEELKTFCRQHLAGFKMPKTFIFQTLPKTSTGKIQKFELRNIVKKL
ncbi:MAG: acyl-CoA synthetase [alpha proteobacterium HIMB59]|jgi:fatty-acyl-CoA synthase|nr:MAG: acyl-CoA synthetase [alpha proteobacterium HIMB59]|tara:strand:- start:2884 stop:4509 length:1626 start_codon:yes stop_codon:yes gene_type:complete